jgi:hypothetical protein
MVGELQPGDPQSAGPYRLLGRLGADGMGHVYLGRPPRGKTGGGQGYTAEIGRDSGFRIRFAREVGAAQNVSRLFTALALRPSTGTPGFISPQQKRP